MAQTIQVGTILVQESATIAELGLELERYSGNWSVVKSLEGLDLARQIRGAGWNFFFMAAEVKTMFFGALVAKNIQKALTRIFVKVKPQIFNGLEVTGIVGSRFFGVPYTIVSAHSCHIQQSCYLNGAKGR
jgi:hypothetical protein